MHAVIVDTDVAIDYLRGEEYARALLMRLWEENTAHMSILSAFELYAGMRNKEREKTEDFIAACTIEEVSLSIARQAGELYRLNRSRGITLAPIDCLIAATANLRGHKIATRNLAHYPDKKLLLPL